MASKEDGDTNDGNHTSKDQKKEVEDTALADAAAQEKVNLFSTGMLSVRDHSLGRSRSANLQERFRSSNASSYRVFYYRYITRHYPASPGIFDVPDILQKTIQGLPDFVACPGIAKR
jgi:hypothetical protein